MAGRLACPSVLSRPFDVVNRSPLAENTVVLLLGWAGAKDVNLAKYSRIYEERGFTTLRFTGVFSGTLVTDLHRGRDLSLLLRDFDSVFESPSTRLLVHLFSMNACYTFASLLGQRGQHILDRTDAVIFDSCPIPMFPLAIEPFRLVLDFALERVFPGDSLKARFMRFLVRTYKLIVIIFQLGIGWKKEAQVSPAQFIKELNNFPLQQLFIFSKKDIICSDKSIAAFADWQESARGATVRRLRFEDSPHVEHYKNHPKEYVEAVDALLHDLSSVKSRI